MEQDMIALLSTPEVRRMGDSLDFVEAYIADRSQTSAARALDELYFRVNRESLGGSAGKVLDELNRLKDYPEAEYWIGETYMAEGALDIALKQYQLAYQKRSLLENPGFGTELLYKMAEVHKIRQEYNEMEQRLLEILREDSLWLEDSDSFVRRAMTQTLSNDGINRFLTLYRHSSPRTEKAHRLLGNYYYTAGRYSHAVEHLSFAFLIQNTILIDEILRNQYDFAFTTIEDLLAEINRRPNLRVYIEEVDYYKTMYYLGTAFYGDGKLQTARGVWTILSRIESAGEWRTRSQSQLRSPILERVIDMP
jgi:tetratricopeptide (TPR) repeat protein